MCFVKRNVGIFQEFFGKYGVEVIYGGCVEKNSIVYIGRSGLCRAGTRVARQKPWQYVFGGGQLFCAVGAVKKPTSAIAGSGIGRGRDHYRRGANDGADLQSAL